MKKNLTKEQVVATALELMRDQVDLRTLSLREVARSLGCAHTNLYNYFPTYHDLLWEAHAALQERFAEIMTAKLAIPGDAEQKLQAFFRAFVDFYLDHKGWFRLAWQEYLGGERPQRDVTATEEARHALDGQLAEIWGSLSGASVDMARVKRVLHNAHCYMVGEISNDLLGRGVMDSVDALKDSVTHEATNLFRLCMEGA